MKNGKKYYAEGLRDELYINNLEKFLIIITQFKLEQTRNNFENLIEYLIYNPKYIKFLDFFFPFQHFKSKEMEISCYFIEMISILYNKQINFKLQFENLNDTKERKIYKLNLMIIKINYVIILFLILIH